MQVSANDQVNVTGPNMIAHTIHPLGMLDQGQQPTSATTIQVNVMVVRGFSVWFSCIGRGVTRLGGAQAKKQDRRPHV